MRIGATDAKREASQDTITGNIGLVNEIAGTIFRKVSRVLPPEDLRQVGAVALIEAAGRYREQGYRFSTYAYARVRGAMIDAIRHEVADSRAAQDKRRRIAAAGRTLEVRLGRPAREAELARFLGLAPSAYRRFADAAQPAQDLPIAAVGFDIADDRPTIEQHLLQQELSTALRDSVDRLSGRERDVLRLFFEEEQDLATIGARLRVTPSRVCQIKREALARLRTMMAGFADAAA